MQPDQQSNYWQHNPDEVGAGETPDTPEPSELYTPSSDDDTNSVIDDEKTENSAVIDDDTVHWDATEYINEEKGYLWFTLFIIIALGLIATDIFLIKSYTFSVLVLVMAVAIMVFSRRPPRTIDYTLSGDQGLYVGDRLYHFSEFKAFGLIKDRGHNSIMLIPVKRFSAGVFVYFPEEVGEQIVDILGARLPMENLKLDLIDIVVRKLRL